ncbi:MAG: tetratricopeptide repeat protein [Bryobacterales bacterium]|nr:tetratricopeptide repeat protein [Bryobacterales bacterium]
MSRKLALALLGWAGVAALGQQPRPGAEPADPNLKVAEIQSLLKQQRYKDAEAKAKELNRLMPDELTGYGLLADAQMAQGKLDEAEKNIQWMLDLRRGDPRGMVRAARFRSLTGDPEGALQMYEMAFQRMPGAAEERAAIVAEMAKIEARQGRRAEAQRLEKLALELGK